MRCKISRTLLSVARMWRRMDASSGLAESASSPSPTMEPVILSSKNRLAAGRGRERRWAFSSPRPPRRTPWPTGGGQDLGDVQQLPGVRLPPMLARWRDPATAAPRQRRAAAQDHLLHGSRWSQPAGPSPPPGSVSGRRRRALSLPSSVTALVCQHVQHTRQLQGLHGFFKSICHEKDCLLSCL